MGNPTGYRLDPRLVGLLCRHAPHVLIALDEAYSDFVGVDFTALAATTPGLFSIRSFSQVGFPGLRVGYLVGHSETLGRVAPFVPAFPISGLSLVAAQNALEQRSQWADTIQRQCDAREWLAEQLRQRGIEVIASPANWVLAHIGPSAELLADHLAAQGVLVWHANHPSLSGYLRISTPDQAALEMFLEVLDAILTPPFVEVNGLLRLPASHGLRPVHRFTVERWITGLNQGDIEGLLRLFAPTPHICDAANPPLAGPDAARVWVEEFFQRTSERQFQVVELAEGDGQMFAHWLAVLTFPARGTVGGVMLAKPLTVALRGVSRFQFDESGKIEQLDILHETSSIPQAARRAVRS